MLAHLLYPAINDGAIQSATIDQHFLTAGAVPMAFVTAHTFHKQLHWKSVGRSWFENTDNFKLNTQNFVII
jgi:hypothetical protein